MVVSCGELWCHLGLQDLEKTGVDEDPAQVLLRCRLILILIILILILIL